MNSRLRDERLGENGEAAFYSLLRESYPKARKQIAKFHRFDFFDRETDTDFELKTRRCAVTKYPQIFISAGKVRAGRLRRSNGIATNTIYVWSFETPGWDCGREYWAWRDDGRELETEMNGARGRGDRDKELMLIPRDLLLPWNMFVVVEKRKGTLMPSLPIITEKPAEDSEEGLAQTRTGSYSPSQR